jgi:hypothetical protein
MFSESEQAAIVSPRTTTPTAPTRRDLARVEDDVVRWAGPASSTVDMLQRY